MTKKILTNPYSKKLLNVIFLISNLLYNSKSSSVHSSETIYGDTLLSRLLFKIDALNFQGLNKLTFFIFSPSFIKIRQLIGVRD